LSTGTQCGYGWGPSEEGEKAEKSGVKRHENVKICRFCRVFRLFRLEFLP
jgi:hypothetical protein